MQMSINPDSMQINLIPIMELRRALEHSKNRKAVDVPTFRGDCTSLNKCRICEDGIPEENYEYMNFIYKRGITIRAFM